MSCEYVLKDLLKSLLTFCSDIEICSGIVDGKLRAKNVNFDFVFVSSKTV